MSFWFFCYNIYIIKERGAETLRDPKTHLRGSDLAGRGLIGKLRTCRGAHGPRNFKRGAQSTSKMQKRKILLHKKLNPA